MHPISCAAGDQISTKPSFVLSDQLNFYTALPPDGMLSWFKGIPTPQINSPPYSPNFETLNGVITGVRIAFGTSVPIRTTYRVAQTWTLSGRLPTWTLADRLR